MSVQADPRRPPPRDAPASSSASTPTSRPGAALLRVLILAGAGAGTCLVYAAVLARLTGLELGWIGLVAPGTIGLLIGGASGLLLGARRRNGRETNVEADADN